MLESRDGPQAERVVEEGVCLLFTEQLERDRHL